MQALFFEDFMQCVGPPSFGGVCKACVACRINHASSWAVRGSHERSLHADACSITLTYDRDNDAYPWSGLQKKHFQDFFKRLRRHLEYYDLPGQGFKYMACGEYGELDDGSIDFSHPHYHAVFFGLDFPDKYFWRNGKLGHKLYRSPTLEKIWTFGNCEIGGAEDEMIAYVSSYILKKVTGDRQLSHYFSRRFCDVLGNHFDFLYNQEFFLSSRRPAIGLRFLENYWDDIFAYNEVVINGQRKPVPPYYLNKLRDQSEIFYRQFKLEAQSRRVDNFAKTASNALTSRKLARKTNLLARKELHS